MGHWLDYSTVGKSNKLPEGVNFDWNKDTPVKPIKNQIQLKNVALQKTVDVPKYNIAHNIYLLLQAEGIQQPALGYAVAQCYAETEGWTNNGYKRYNNASGIKFAGQRNARLGPNGYAIFDTWKDWAHAMAHELTKGANPSGAASMVDYNNRLHANGYYEEDPAVYLRELQTANKRLLKMTHDLDTNYNNYQNKAEKDKAEKDAAKAKSKDGIPWWGWGLIGLSGVYLYNRITE